MFTFRILNFQCNDPGGFIGPTRCGEDTFCMDRMDFDVALFFDEINLEFHQRTD